MLKRGHSAVILATKVVQSIKCRGANNCGTHGFINNYYLLQICFPMEQMYINRTLDCFVVFYIVT